MGDDLIGEGGWFSYEPVGDWDEVAPLTLTREHQRDIRIMCEYGVGLPIWHGGGHISESVSELSDFLGVSVEVLELLREEQGKWDEVEGGKEWTSAEVEAHRELAARFAAEFKPPFRLVDVMF